MNYEEYDYTRWEFLKYFSIGFLLGSGVSYLFYQSIFMILLSSPFSLFYVKRKKKQLIANRKQQLNLEFREGILSLSAALNAGYSIENAFSEAIKDLQLIYSADSWILQEFQGIVHQISMNKTVEEALQDLANRSGIEDIDNFSEVFQTAKRTGGNIIKIIQKAAKNIGDKIEMKRQIQTLITAKKLEARIMNIIPLVMIVYLWIFSPGFLNPLYHNGLGIFIMTCGLIGYLGAYLWAENIIDIRV